MWELLGDVHRMLVGLSACKIMRWGDIPVVHIAYYE